MNRVILIGNGFDLAHCLKTSYNDFIEWILESKFNKIKESNFSYCDYDIEYHNNDLFIQNIKFDAFKTAFIYETSPILTTILGDKIERYSLVVYHNHFMQLMIENKYFKNWSDIETLFYDELNELLNSKHTTDKEIEKFNSDFQRIIDLLEEYLSVVSESFILNNTKVKDRISSLLDFPIYQHDLSIEFKRNNKPIRGEFVVAGEEIEAPNVKNYDKCLIIDFNYTQIIKHYFYENKFHYVNIHGELNNPDNKIIFGFGDELDDDYIKIEKSRLKGVMNYIKSINYLNTVNYRNVLEFLEIENYQVFVWGHSCGLTDRTLLNHIFEHNNCAGIKPYYHQKYDKETKEYTNNYIEIVANIARNFKNKNKLRDRVVNLDYCEPLIK